MSRVLDVYLQDKFVGLLEQMDSGALVSTAIYPDLSEKMAM